jgi:glucose/arabinose dehydrogenase
MFASVIALGAVAIPMSGAQAQQVPTLLDPTLKLETLVTTGIPIATSLSFINSTDYIVSTKGTGKIRLFATGQTPVDLTFDIPASTWTNVTAGNYPNLPVNSLSERGLLCVQLHPDFATNKYVYTYATESSTGANVSQAGQTATALELSSVVPLGNRVDRWVYDSVNKKLVFDMNIIKLQALQPLDATPIVPTGDANATLRGNHNGGIIRFEKKVAGQPARMFVIIGDNGRRGMMQNLQYGPTTGTTRIADVGNFGPEPDNRALTGVVIRLNDDGTIPTDNPFYNHTLTFSGQTDAGLQNEAVANLKRVYAYGIRNSFGLAVDPFTGKLWESDNGDDAMDELNVIGSGFNGGWIQFMGPKSRIADFNSIEAANLTGTAPNRGSSLGNQNRYPVSNIATTTAIGEARLVNIPGATYGDPVFSWKYCIAPNAIGFVNGNGLGAKYNGNLIVGSARGNTGTAGVNANGVLYRFVPNATRTALQFADRLLTDKVADNTGKSRVEEQKSIILGTGFNIVTDIITAPDGSLYILGMTSAGAGNIFRISKK